MSNTKHTPGPWKKYDGRNCIEIGSRSSHVVTFHDGPGGGNDHANAARIVACVNACEGINPEAVREMLEALKEIKHGLVGTKARELAARVLARAEGGGA